MKKMCAFLFLSSAMLAIFSMETGKVTDYPSSAKQYLELGSGIALNEKFATPMFEAEVIKSNLANPLFSMAFHNNRLIGGSDEIVNLDDNSVLAKFEEGEIVYSLLSLDSKTLLAAVQPTGIIIKISDNKIDTIFSSDESINLIKKAGKDVYAAVGNELYALVSGKFERMLKVNDRNILYFQENNQDIYISTEGKGKLIKYSLKNKTQDVVFSLSGGEIPFFLFKGDAVAVVANNFAGGGEGSEIFNGLVISLKDGLADTVAREDFSFSSCTEGLGGMILSASVPARCYFYDFENYLYMGSSENDFIMASLGESKTAYLATAEANSVVKLSLGKKNAEFTSAVIDPLKSVIPTVFYPESRKNGKLYVKSGKTLNVDSAWSSFMLVKAKENESIESSRYIQYKYLFAGQDDTLFNVSFYFKTKNHAPKIKSIKTYPERIIPDYAVLPEWNAELLLKRSFYPEIKDNSIYKSKRNVRFFSWESSDIDMDRLVYDAHLVSGNNVYLVKKSFLESYAVINLESFPEGSYRMRITASDSLDNLSFLEGTIEGEDFTVDRTAPDISNDSYEKNVLVLTANDKVSKIDSAEYSVNGDVYRNALPSDGVFDSKSEKFEINIPREKNQSLSIVVRVYDASGNCAVLSKAVK